jgi:5-methylcytosine-specific restriction endonuclease McrA
MARINRPKTKLTILFNKQNGLCAICGLQAFNPVKSPGKVNKAVATLDHIVPLSKGGTSHIKNLQMAHQYCNVCRDNSEVTPELVQAVIPEIERAIRNYKGYARMVKAKAMIEKVMSERGTTPKPNERRSKK